MSAFIIFSVFLVFLIFTPNLVRAEFFVIRQLTDSGTPEAITDIDNGKFIWEGTGVSSSGTSTARQIFLYDGNNVRQLTFDESPIRNVSSRMDGDYVVWVKEDGTVGTGFIPQVFAYQISTGQTIQITNDNYHFKAGTDIAGSKIVWMFWNLNEKQNLMLYDLNTEFFEQITNEPFNGFNNFSPVISESTIAWRKGNSQAGVEILRKDIATGIVTIVSSNSLHKNELTISGSNIAWFEGDGVTDDFEIFLNNGEQTIQITNNELNDHRINLAGDKLVWTFLESGQSKIGIYSIASQITEVIVDANLPNTDGSSVVWLRPFPKPEFNTNSNEIFTRNESTGEIIQVTEDAFVLGTPSVSGDLIAWYGEPRTSSTIIRDVFIAQPGNTPPGTNINVSLDPVELTFSQVDAGGNSAVTTSATGNQPPVGFKLGNPPTYYNIETTALFSGPVEVCINYDENTIQGNENNLRLTHFTEGAGWLDITTSLDASNNIICGETSSFSEFIFATQPTIQDLIDRVEEMNLQQGIENSLDVKLSHAQDALIAEQNNNVSVAVNALYAVINEVEAQRGIKLTERQADELHSFADNLIKIVNGVKEF